MRPGRGYYEGNHDIYQKIIQETLSVIELDTEPFGRTYTPGASSAVW